MKESDLALNGKVILIMGGTSGLGLSGAIACVNAGARVLVVGRKQEKVNAAVNILGASSHGIVGDAGHSATAEAAVAAALDRFGELHGLYHVAGGSGRRMGDGPLDQITDEGWDFTDKLNLRSLFYSNRAAVRQFLKQGKGGVVLNLGSVLGLHPSERYFATHAYAATKSAAIGLTKSCAAHYASRNIRFNILLPALVATPMSERAQLDERIMAFIQSKQPLDGGRIGQPEDYDAAVVFLLSDGARFVTGQALSIDGGWSLSDGQYEE